MNVDALIIEIAETGREATDTEIQRIRSHVASAGFQPELGLNHFVLNEPEGERWILAPFNQTE